MILKMILLAMLGALAVPFATLDLPTAANETPENPEPKITQVRHLDLSNHKRPLSDLNGSTELVSLNMSSYGLRYAPEVLTQMTKLEKLLLAENTRLDLNSVLAKAPLSLVELDLSGCSQVSVPMGLNRFEKLEVLDLSHNHLLYLPADIERLDNLRKVDLSGNQLRDISNTAAQWWGIEELDVTHNRSLNYNGLFKALAQHDKLEVLKVSDLGKVKKHFAQVPSKRLEIDHSPAVDFKGALAENQFIQVLVLKGEFTNRARILQEANESMNLRRLILRLGLGAIPPDLVACNRITELDLRNNGIQEVAALAKMPMLEYVNLSGNPIPVERVEALRQAMPDCKIVYEAPDVVAAQPLAIAPPLKSYDIPFAETVVRTDEQSSITGAASHVTIPSNAFLNANGEVVEGPVTVKYREFMDPASIVLSGIPMKFDQDGVQYNFSSAGMVEFRAFDEAGNELMPNPQSPVEIEITSRTGASAYDLYAYDEENNVWEAIGDDEVETLPQDPETMKLLNSKFPVEPTYSNGALGAYQQSINSLRIFTERVLPSVRHYSPTKSFRFDFRRLASSSFLRMRNFDVLEAFEGEILLYDGQNKHEDFVFLDSIFDEMKLEYGKQKAYNEYPEDAPVFITDLTIEKTEDSHQLLLKMKYKDTLLVYPVYPHVDEAGTDRMVKQFRKFDEETEGLCQETREANAKLDADVARAVEKLKKELERSGIKTDAKNYADLVAQYEEARRSTEGAKRSFSAGVFGVLNCDRISRMVEPTQVLAKFIGDDNQEIEPTAAFVLDFVEIGVMPITSLGAITIDAQADFNIVFMIDEKEMAVLPSSVLKKYDYSKLGESIPVQFESIKGISQDKLMEKMSI